MFWEIRGKRPDSFDDYFIVKRIAKNSVGKYEYYVKNGLSQLRLKG